MSDMIAQTAPRAISDHTIGQLIDARRRVQNSRFLMEDDYSRALWHDKQARFAEIVRDTEAYIIATLSTLTPRQLLDAWRGKVITRAEYGAAMARICAARGLRGPQEAV